MDVLTRYDADGTPLHLRCHFVDVTDRVAAERELRLQSARLAQANALLRQSNAGLERLKESYRDLYHQAPVLYFSLDPRGRFAACNDTMLGTLGYSREDLLGKPYTRLLTAEGARRFLQDPGAYARTGRGRARWVKKDGSVIDVWVRTAPILDEQGRFVRSRSAAQDVTETQPPGQRRPRQGRGAAAGQRAAAAHQPGAGGVHLRRLARPQGAAAHAGGVQHLPAAGLRRRRWAATGPSTSATWSRPAAASAG